MSEMKDSGYKFIGEIPKEWKIERLNSVANLYGRIGWQGLTSDEYTDEGAWLVTGTDFKNGYIDWDSCVHVPERRWKEAFQIQLANGDLLITKDGTVGKLAIVKDMPGPSSLNSGVMRIVPIGIDYEVKFLYYVLQTDIFREWFKDINAGASTIQHLFQGDFKHFLFPLPPLDEQIDIANQLTKQTSLIDETIEVFEQQIDVLERYKKSIIHEAVTKGLDPNVAMRPSGVEWIGDIPGHWTAERVSYHAQLESGHTPSTQHTEWWKDEECVIPWITTSDVHRFRDGRITSIEDTEEHISKIGLANSSARLLPQGTVALSRTASVGFSVIMDAEMASSQDFADWVPKAEISSKYLLYVFRSMEKLFDQLKMGSTHKTIYMHVLKTIKMPLPPALEQRQIADYLDEKCAKADAILDIKRKQVEVLKKRRQSLIYEYVTGKKRVGKEE